MENIIGLIKNYDIYIILVMLLIVVIGLILIIIIFSRLNRVEDRYRKMMRGADNKNIEQIITSYMSIIDSAKEDSQNTKQMCEELNEKLESCIQKFSMLRYRAFEDVGSDLSFSMALLNNKNDGTIITGIYGRSESTTYAKPIDKGISRYELSKEEKQVLENAMNNIK